MFIGRERELEEIREKLSNDRFESILIYGRRRIGKTELIKEAAHGFDGTFVYFECKKGLYGDNLDAFTALLRERFGQPLSFSDFKEALTYVFQYAKTHKTALVIDEFPFLWKVEPSLISHIRDLIDDYHGQSQMKFILSGSLVESMKSLNDGKSETFGRFTGIIELKAFDYYESSLFYPSYSDEDKILMYSVFGGVAFFNSLIDPRLDALSNIERLLLRPHSILQLEVENTIEGEVSKIPAVNSVILLLASGVHKYSDIANQLRMKSGSEVNPDYVLKKMIDLEIIEKVAPINDKDNKKRIFYRFSDNLMEFYYRYIYRNKSENSMLPPKDFYLRFVKDDLEKSYLPKKFESIARQFLIRKSQRHELPELIYDIGTYSFDDAKLRINRQFDVVTRDERGYISYECKYSNRPLGQDVIAEEEHQLLSSGLGVYRLGFISKSGFSVGVDGSKYNLFSLSDFYK